MFIMTSLDASGAIAERIGAAVFYGIRPERQLMEQLDYNLLYRWLVGFRPTTQSGTRPPSPRTATDCRTASVQEVHD